MVAPVGLGNSFNAGPCCGQALRDGVDDMGFMCAVKRHLKERVMGLPPDSDVDAFAVGWSNGGGDTAPMDHVGPFTRASSPRPPRLPYI